jgi:RNA polymerase sigma factor
MRDLDINIIRARQDAACYEDLLIKMEPYILRITSRLTGRFVTKSDDEWSVSLSAFHEAVQCYSYEKGSFIPFAETVIKRRLYDHIRRKTRNACETPVNPAYFGNDGEEETSSSIRMQIMEKITTSRDEDARWEIQALSSVLQDYGFSFFELVSVSPKAEKTKEACAKVISFILNHPALLKGMRKSKTIPTKIILEGLHLPRKVLERHRKYIIAAVEILDGSYPILSEYLKYIKEV